MIGKGFQNRLIYHKRNIIMQRSRKQFRTTTGVDADGWSDLWYHANHVDLQHDDDVPHHNSRLLQ